METYTINRDIICPENCSAVTAFWSAFLRVYSRFFEKHAQLHYAPSGELSIPTKPLPNCNQNPTKTKWGCFSSFFSRNQCHKYQTIATTIILVCNDIPKKRETSPLQNTARWHPLLVKPQNAQEGHFINNVAIWSYYALSLSVVHFLIPPYTVCEHSTSLHEQSQQWIMALRHSCFWLSLFTHFQLLPCSVLTLPPCLSKLYFSISITQLRMFFFFTFLNDDEGTFS